MTYVRMVMVASMMSVTDRSYEVLSYHGIHGSYPLYADPDTLAGDHKSFGFAYLSPALVGATS